MSLKNMKAEMTREGVTQQDVADLLGMTSKNVNLKLSEKVPMTIDEGKSIRAKFFPFATLDYLLESDKEENGELRTA